MKKYTKHIRNIFISICIMSIAVALLNYKLYWLIIDKDSQTLNKVAHDISKGHIVAGVHPTRLLKQRMIEYSSSGAEWIAFGSSTIMGLYKEAFLKQNDSFYNYSVGSGRLKDYLILFYIYKEKFGFPKNIILGLDPWLFNKTHKNPGNIRFLEYHKFLNEIGGLQDEKLSSYINLSKGLLSFNYLIAKANSIIGQVSNYGKRDYYVVDSVEVNDAIIKPDGSYMSNGNGKYPNPNDTLKKAKQYKPFRINHFKQIDNRLFEAFIKHLKNKGVNIYFWLPPYHPIAYDLIVSQKRYKMVEKTEQYLRNLANKNNIQVLNSYSPYEYNLTNSDFADATHTLRKVFPKTFKDIKIKR